MNPWAKPIMIFSCYWKRFEKEQQDYIAYIDRNQTLGWHPCRVTDSCTQWQMAGMDLSFLDSAEDLLHVRSVWLEGE